MREWIVTNGLGSYASLTYANTSSRKFHGLLVASLDPPTKRWVFVSHLNEEVILHGKTYKLQEQDSTFLFDVFPSFSYTINDITLKKTIFMDYGKNTTVLKYEVDTKTPVSLTIAPYISSRHFYDVCRPGAFTVHQNIIEHGVEIKPSNVEKNLKILLQDSKYAPAEQWVECWYQRDRERNDSWRDHVLSIGNFSKTLDASGTFYLICTIEDEREQDPSTIFQREEQRRQNIRVQACLPSRFDKLVLSTDNFVVKRGDGKSIIAGYHWFGDWGRDTLISLPGISLVTKRYSEAKQILLNFSRYCLHGLIPNAFMDRDSKAVYNTVDASLWYVDRVYQYLKYTNDRDFIKEIWPTLQSIVEGYKNGTDFGIHMDNDFLISHGEGLTWMDVKLGDYYPTPRAKKAVEIQALWYNALRIMSMLSTMIGKDTMYHILADNMKRNFIRNYDHLYDVIDTKDTSMRPNQIFLVSLDFPLVEKELQEHIVQRVQDKLVTFFGLRTLSPEDSRYKGTYLGAYHRDLAYHNGTVWPWLLGPFLKAFVKVKNHDPVWRDYAYKTFLQPMIEVFGDEWDGSISEIFDGDPPYHPQGCITQAWSVAEILRAWVEDIENIAPPYENQFCLDEVRV